MDRRTFLIGGIMATATLNELHSLKESVGRAHDTDSVMPALFVGHGNPMNAIQKNEFHNTWEELGKSLPRPKAILCISAHWLTSGTKVTAMQKPRTIHDFFGFPDELFAQQYPAPGSPEYAVMTEGMVHDTVVMSDYEWGLDHGTWSVLLPMYPKADIPVFQMSLDYTKSPQFHYDLGKQLSALRSKGVLIIGSGNIVHNLRMMRYSGEPYDWAVEFDEKMRQLLVNGDHKAMIEYEKLGSAARLAIPTNEHYLPLLYTLGVQGKDEPISFFNDKLDGGSISMRSMRIG